MTAAKVKILKQFFHQVAELASETLTAFVENEEKPIQTFSRPAIQENRLLNQKQLAERLNVSARTISNLQNEGLPTVKLGKRILFDYDDVLIWAKDKEIKGRRKSNLSVVR
jgi:excisionase family DNA binding protein